MDEEQYQRQISDINRKLDVILEEIELQKKHRLEMEELKADLMRVGKDVYESAVGELEEVQDHISTGDILYLSKKILRNINNLTRMLESLENVRGFIEDFAPVSRELVTDLMTRLDEYDRKGYFEAARELMNVMNRVMEHLTPEDIRRLGDSAAAITGIMKRLTQPGMLQAIERSLSVYNGLDFNSFEPARKISLFSLLREIKTPEMQKSLGFGIKFLKELANHHGEERAGETSN
jgi:uncharacterized protein YjgD (DUF1641 family)